MKCYVCGAEIAQGSQICPECNNRIAFDDYMYKEVPPTENVVTYDEKQFYQKFASKNIKSWVIAIGVMAIVSGVASVSWLFLGNLLSIIDIVFYITFGILILTLKKWGFTLTVTVYSGVFSLITLATTEQFTGWLVLIAGIISTIGLRKINKAYNLYKWTGQVPAGEIA